MALIEPAPKPVRWGFVSLGNGVGVPLEGIEGEPFYTNEPGGLFWNIKFKGGIYNVEASKRLGYHEVTHTATKAAAEAIHPGSY